MARLAPVVIGLACLASAGCATEGFVKQQVDPVADRIGRLESRVKELDARLDALEKRPTVSLADFETFRKQVTEASLQAQQSLGSTLSAGIKVDAAASRAEAAAGRAEAAANRAELSSQRATKAFELEQRK